MDQDSINQATQTTGGLPSASSFVTPFGNLQEGNFHSYVICRVSFLPEKKFEFFIDERSTFETYTDDLWFAKKYNRNMDAQVSNLYISKQEDGGRIYAVFPASSFVDGLYKHQYSQLVLGKLTAHHAIENSINKEMGEIDKFIKTCEKQIEDLNNKKRKLSKRISENMKYRNILIEELHGKL